MCRGISVLHNNDRIVSVCNLGANLQKRQKPPSEISWTSGSLIVEARTFRMKET